MSSSITIVWIYALSFQETFIADKQLIELAIHACQSTALTHRYHCGRIVSGEYFVEDPTLKESLSQAYSPLCLEMEGAAIGHVAFINRIPVPYSALYF